MDADRGFEGAGGRQLIDRHVLEGLLEMIGAEALTEVVDSCRRQFQACRCTVAAALDGRDVQALRLIAHDLKSSAGNIGLTDLNSLARAVETACRENRHGDALQLARGLTDHLDQACAAIDAIGPVH